METRLEDTIAAISTASGRAGIAVVRVSGADALRVARSLGADGLEPRRARLADIRHPDGGALDRALITWYPAPASYTGEDVIEISTHGGILVPSLVLDAACAAGARPAEAGEFTRRAYLNGKLDLVQVEATQDLIDAVSEAHQRAALHQLEGGLSRRVNELREALLELQALIAYDIDFPEEDEGPVPPERVLRSARAARTAIEELLANAPEGELLRAGALTVLAGAPNSGKSSIFNALLGSERAIVTQEPGTTRDAIEALASVEGYPFRLVDTAGVRETDEPVERIGIEVARRYLERADVVLLCVEATRAVTGEERSLAAEARGAGADVLLLRTKSDLLGHGAASDGTSGAVVSGTGASPAERNIGEGASRSDGGDPADGEGVAVSVVTGEGLSELRRRLVKSSFGGLRRAEEPPLVTRKRQVRSLRAALEELDRFREAFEAGHPAEIASAHLQGATHALEELVGVTDVEDLLGAIFASFCVGK